MQDAAVSPRVDIPPTETKNQSEDYKNNQYPTLHERIGPRHGQGPPHYQMKPLH